MGERKTLSKAELVKVLTAKVESWIASGISPAEAIEKLTPRQYDFLIDQNVDLDKYLMTDEQLQASKEVRRSARTVKEGGYNKKYPQSKQDLYNGIMEYIKTQGATIIPRDKQNFRDLDFTIGDTKYKIVLSNPRS